MHFIGIDGCRGGWLFSILSQGGDLEVLLFPLLKDGLEYLLNSDAVCIDMPMGLVSGVDEERTCDALIRKELGYPFSSSVFNVPCRQAVYASCYKEANRLNKEICGKGLSVQSWNITDKIKELDQLLAHYPALHNKMHESHPELSFKYLKGEALSYRKKTMTGKEERIGLLCVQFPNVKSEFLKFRQLYLKKDVADDDLLDSMVLAYSARQIAAGDYKRFPAEDMLDSNGVGMGVYIAQKHF